MANLECGPSADGSTDKCRQTVLVHSLFVKNSYNADQYRGQKLLAYHSLTELKHTTCFRHSGEYGGHGTRSSHGRHETSLLGQVPPQMKRYWYLNSDVKTRWGDLRRRQLTLHLWLIKKSSLIACRQTTPTSRISSVALANWPCCYMAFLTRRKPGDT